MNEAEKETRRRFLSNVANDLKQIERTIKHYLPGMGNEELLDLADRIWYHSWPGKCEKPTPDSWWHNPEVW